MEQPATANNEKYVFVLRVEDLQNDTWGSCSSVIGIYTTREKMIEAFLTYLSENCVYDLCTEEEIEDANNRGDDPVFDFSTGSYPSCDGRHFKHRERELQFEPGTRWTRSELIDHFCPETHSTSNNQNKKTINGECCEYTLADSAIFAWDFLPVQ